MSSSLMQALSMVRNPNRADVASIPPLTAGSPGDTQAIGNLYDALIAQATALAGLPVDLAQMATQARVGAHGGTQEGAWPMSSDWLAQKAGADTESVPYLLSAMMAAGPGGKARAAKKVTEAGAGKLSGVLTARPAPRDYENEIKFIEADTVVPDVDARIKTTGHYRGAPYDVVTPQKLGSMRRSLESLLEAGVPGRLWYDQSARAAGELTGGRRNFKHLFAGANAITSRGAAVPVNQVFGVRGYNQAIMGRPIDAGRFPTDQGAAIEILKSGDTYHGGPKETPFYEGLTVDERGEIRPTNDLWMARAFGYKRKNPETGQMEEWGEGLGEAQHRFMDKEIKRLVEVANEKKIGGFDDWTPERVQAAVWVAQKSASEGIPVSRAKADFSHNLDDLTATIRYEANPSGSLNHLPGISATDEYADIVQSGLQNDAGQDLLALEAGALTQPSDRGYGIYQGQTSPSMGTRILAAPGTGSDELDEAGSSLLRALGSVRGMNLGQETVGITNFRDAKNAGRYNIARVNQDAAGGRNLSQLAEALSSQFGDAAIPLHAPDGFDVRYFGEDGSGFKKQLNKMLGNRSAEYGRDSAPGLIGNTDFDGYRPSAWMREIDRANLSPEATARLERGAQNEASTLLKLDQVIQESVPDAGQADQILTTTREILSREGFAGIRKAVEAGILPAIVLTVFAGAGADQTDPAGSL